MITCTLSSGELLDFDHMGAARLMLPARQGEALQIVLVGCGGTGSWLAPHLARLARLLIDNGQVVDLRFCDPDLVEEKNIYRQNFCQAEIGRYKAETLAQRFGHAWGLDIRQYATAYSAAVLHTEGSAAVTRLIVGCVDNAAARRDVARDASGHRAWWVDCGNHHSNGQVLLGGGFQPVKSELFRLPGRVPWAPLPSQQHPELLADEQSEAEAAQNMSCAEAAIAGAQGLTVNAMVAAVAADMLYRMLVTKDLDRCAVYFDLASGAMRSRWLTEKELFAYYA